MSHTSANFVAALRSSLAKLPKCLIVDRFRDGAPGACWDLDLAGQLRHYYNDTAPSVTEE